MYNKLQMVCNRAYTMEKLCQNFDAGRILSGESDVHEMSPESPTKLHSPKLRSPAMRSLNNSASGTPKRLDSIMANNYLSRLVDENNWDASRFDTELIRKHMKNSKDSQDSLLVSKLNKVAIQRGMAEPSEPTPSAPSNRKSPASRVSSNFMRAKTLMMQRPSKS